MRAGAQTHDVASNQCPVTKKLYFGLLVGLRLPRCVLPQCADVLGDISRSAQIARVEREGGEVDDSDAYDVGVDAQLKCVTRTFCDSTRETGAWSNDTVCSQLR